MDEYQGGSESLKSRPRHLMDPAAPIRDQYGSVGMTRVQTWVLSVLVVTTLVHLAGGLLVSAWFIDSDQTSVRVGLSTIASVVCVLAIAAGRAIHKLSVFTWWLVLGVLPGVVAFVLFV